MMEQATEQLAVRQEEAAKLLGVCVRTVRRLTNENKIPHKRLGRYSVIYPVDALKDWAHGEFKCKKT